eukprot:2852628-Rhodomonas_salina.2
MDEETRTMERELMYHGGLQEKTSGKENFADDGAGGGKKAVDYKMLYRMLVRPRSMLFHSRVPRTDKKCERSRKRIVMVRHAGFALTSSLMLCLCLLLFLCLCLCPWPWPRPCPCPCPCLCLSLYICVAVPLPVAVVVAVAIAWRQKEREKREREEEDPTKELMIKDLEERVTVLQRSLGLAEGREEVLKGEVIAMKGRVQEEGRVEQERKERARVEAEVKRVRRELEEEKEAHLVSCPLSLPTLLVLPTLVSAYPTATEHPVLTCHLPTPPLRYILYWLLICLRHCYGISRTDSVPAYAAATERPVLTGWQEARRAIGECKATMARIRKTNKETKEGYVGEVDEMKRRENLLLKE